MTVYNRVENVLKSRIENMGARKFYLFHLFVAFFMHCDFCFDIQNYPFVQNLSDYVQKTFPGYDCINLLINHTHVYTESIFLNLHYSNYAFVLMDIGIIETHGKNELATSNCHGYIVAGTNVSNSIQVLNHKMYELVPRMLIIDVQPKIDSTFSNKIDQRDYKFFQDKDILFIHASKINTTFFLSNRYGEEFTNIDPNRMETFFPPRDAKPQIWGQKRHEVKVVTFDCPVFGAIILGKDADPVLSDGVETRIFLEIASQLNFSWKVFIPEGDAKWGTAFPNKTISGGILKYLHNSKADIGFCSLWIESTKFEYIHMSRYWASVCLRFLIPKPKSIAFNWESIFRPLPLNVWLLILVANTVVSNVYCIILYVNDCISDKSKSESVGISTGCIRVTGMLLLASTPKTNKTSRNADRNLLTWWSVFAMVATSAYSSSLISHVTFPEYQPMLTTIKQLVNAGYYWGTPYYPPLDSIFNLNNKWHKEFADRFKYETKKQSRIRRTIKGNYAVLTKCIDNHFMEVDEIPPHVLHDLRTNRKCLNYFLLGFGFRKAFPYTKHASIIIGRLQESGITTYWLDRIFEKLYSPAVFSKAYEYKDPQENTEDCKPLSLKHLKGVFYLWLTGIALSFFVFFLEYFHLWFK